MKRTLIILSAMIMGLSACQKSIEEFTPYPGQPATGDSSWVNSFSTNLPLVSLKNDLRKPVFTDIINIPAGSVPQTFTLSSGITCSITGGILNLPGGNSATGPITAYSYQLQNKGDVIRMGTHTGFNNLPFKSGGQFFLALKKDSLPVSLSQGAHLSLRYQSNISNPEMSLYKEIPSNNPWSFNWGEDMIGDVDRVPGANNLFNIHTTHFGWLQVAERYDSLVSNLRVEASLPPYNTNANSIAYLLIDGSFSVMPMLPDAVSRKFRAFNVPVNCTGKIVVISKMGNNYYWGMSPFNMTGTSPQYTLAVPVIPRLSSLADILDNLERI